MNIIFDLDGTVVDSKLRLYRLFQALAPESGLSFEEYWALKKNGTSNRTILSAYLGYDEAQNQAFDTKWMSLIETPFFLSLDRNFGGIHNALRMLRIQADLHVCTSRQLRELAIEQLAHLGLLPHLTQVMVTEQKHAKRELILKHIPNLSHTDWMVGDTGNDIQVGRSLNLKTCGVLTGFLSKEALTGYEPDLIVDSVPAFSALLTSNAILTQGG